MPIPLPSIADGVDVPPPMPTDTVKAVPAPFPARTKQVMGMIAGTQTGISTTQFADKIMITITQEGRLGHWVHVPLSSDDPGHAARRARQGPSSIRYDDEEDLDPDSDLLPLPHLTATTILGAGTPERDTLGQLLGTQIGTALTARNPNESRLLVLGMGLKKTTGEMERGDFIELVGLVVGCL